MNFLAEVIPVKFYEVLERAGICTVKQIMILSKWDIQKVTNLNSDDILLLKDTVAEKISPASITGDLLVQQQNEHVRIKSGCEAIDKILNGGFRRGCLTEIYGESGSGKTQLGIQAAACNSECGCVYICTEDLFPVKRLEQMKCRIPCYSEFEYGKNIFIEHVTEPSELLSCVKVRLPKLLSSKKLSLIVLDSIAAPYRTDTTNYIQRAEDLREVSVGLIELAQIHNLAVLCINQVTSSFEDNDTLPSLGLSWSNMVSTRLKINKTPKTIDVRSLVPTSQEQFTYIRELSVVFAPDLVNNKVEFVILADGIHNL